MANLDHSKFSVGELFSDQNGKTSGTSFVGILICTVGTICFLLGCIDKMWISKSIDDSGKPTLETYTFIAADIVGKVVLGNDIQPCDVEHNARNGARHAAQRQQQAFRPGRSDEGQAHRQALGDAAGTIESARHIGKRHGAIGTADAEFAFLEFDVVFGRFHQMCRHCFRRCLAFVRFMVR